MYLNASPCTIVFIYSSGRLSKPETEHYNTVLYIVFIYCIYILYLYIVFIYCIYILYLYIVLLLESFVDVIPLSM